MNTFLPQGDGYKKLRVYRLTEIIHDLTMEFMEFAKKVRHPNYAKGNV